MTRTKAQRKLRKLLYELSLDEFRKFLDSIYDLREIVIIASCIDDFDRFSIIVERLLKLADEIKFVIFKFREK